ncbi:MAG TPA: hypothetical protein PLP29_09755 [Candidatus Ozemobacteraceae bacterium]|nr:hypothetical protein [Candidatus Ozemobacteraceae bacterium]
MYCFRCGQELPAKSVNCPACDTPQKRRQRHRQRLLLGLFIFLAGAFTGSVFDSLVFRGRSWDHSLLDLLTGGGAPKTATAPAEPWSDPSWERVSPPAPGVQPNLPAGKKGIVPPGAIVFKPGQPGAPSMAQLPPTDRTVADGLPVPTATETAMTALSASMAPDIASPAGFDEAAEVAGDEVPAIGSETAPVAASEPVMAPPATPEPLPDTDLAPGALEKLETGEGNNYHGSLWLDGDSLLFASNRAAGSANPKYQAYFRSLKGKTGSVRLFSWPGNVWTPEFSKDGKQLVFSSDSAKDEQVFVFDRITQQHRALTDGGHKNMMPALSPDGKFVVFTSNRKGSNDIWLVGIDGDGLVQLTSGPEDDREPRWWPDGKSIVFTRIVQKMKVSHIMRLGIDPVGKPEPLVGEASRNWLADPSPDGRWLAYVRSESDDGSRNVIRVRRLDSGTEFAVTTFGSADAFRPIWTHDGSGLIAHADREGRKGLYLIRLEKKPKP